MKYDLWVETIPDGVRHDSLWKVKAYRLSLYLADLSWNDITKIKNNGVFSLADQLYRATGSIGANIAEGYSRSSFKEKVRFYEYSLGSARESRDWYLKSRHIINHEDLKLRLELLSIITKLLLAMINDKRQKS